MFRIIVGGNNKRYDEIAELASFDDRFELVYDAQDMSIHYQWADMAICAGGSSNWEMSYFGVPRIILVLAENQNSIAEHLAAHDLCINLGDHQANTPKTIGRSVCWLAHDRAKREQMSLASQQMIDGQGVERLFQILTTGGRKDSGQKLPPKVRPNIQLGNNLQLPEFRSENLDF